MESSPAIGLIELVVLIAAAFPLSNILKKAGYSPWLVLLCLIPIVNIVLFLVFAFSDWPRNRAQRDERGPVKIVE